MKLSVLIAFRGSGHREESWKYIAGRFSALLRDAEVVVGTDDGLDPFHKTVALNRAAKEATGDLLMIGDADTWVPSAQVLEGVALIEEDPTLWVRPWTRKVKLSKEDSAVIMKGEAWDGEVTERQRYNGEDRGNVYWAAPPCIFTREAFDRVGGMDERFRGWGQEDQAFAFALRSLVGKPRHIAGMAVHFWHPRIGRSGHDLWVGQESRVPNERLIEGYRSRIRHPKMMEKFIQQRKGRA